jgi:hypothetical protein
MTTLLSGLTGDAVLIFRDGLIHNLSTGILVVYFIKNDGSPRRMRCTRSANIIPQTDESEKRKSLDNADTLPVWDMEAKAKDGSEGDWRSFRIDRLTGVKKEPIVFVD